MPRERVARVMTPLRLSRRLLIERAAENQRKHGVSAYQTLLKSYISEGLRRDEVQFDQHTARKLADALERRGVAEKVLQEAVAEIAHG